MGKWTSVPGPLTRGSFAGLFENHLKERFLDQALDITFLRGVGSGVGGGGGASKVFAQKPPSSGDAHRQHTAAGGMVTQPTESFRSAHGILAG